MPRHGRLLNEMRDHIAVHARPDLQTPIDGLLLSSVTITPAAPEYSLTEPLLVVMAQGGKHLMLGDQMYEYREGDCLVITASLPVTGHWIDTDGSARALGMGLVLRPGRHRRAGAPGPDRAVVACNIGRTGDRDRRGRTRSP